MFSGLGSYMGLGGGHHSQQPQQPQQQPQGGRQLLLSHTAAYDVRYVTDPDLVCPVCTFNVREGGMFDDDDGGGRPSSLVKLNLCGHVGHEGCIQHMAERSKTFIQVI